MKNILVISYSNIPKDARVLRQLSVVKEFGHVTTLAYGDKAVWADEHLQIDSSLPSLPQTLPGVAALASHRFRTAEKLIPAARRGAELVAGRKFDAIVANDARALPLAMKLSGGGTPVWADLHEWAPEERTQVLSWRLLVAPFMRDICAYYLPKTAAQTTVGEQIAKLYERDFGVRPLLMRNAPAWQQLSPSPVDEDKIRLVHSGSAVPGRSIEKMIEAVKQLDDRFSLDFYLTSAGDGGRYLRSLKEIAGVDSRITFHNPVAPADLPATLNAYDVGIFWIPPFNTNARLTLPNKLFDFVQARLAVAVGPTVEMANVVNRYGLGVVSEGFQSADIARTLSNLEAATIRECKERAHQSSKALSFENEAEVARGIFRRLLGEVA
ncbi:MAG: glycosyltransferase [Winkia neuii]|uniref:Glycosyltransferase subfamily 4-like N-terminal domain-containing protein n=1 Tax=Winkia neuii TaxID=33007 RepID=A0A2I1INV3_9ACTO|nr:glycosyltransferase [Winkia neuii]OFJ71578.1 hypothetical protein HMPREF2851_07055 [Actinomyces sp. HMSC064C12]OFK01101.1 hypothetical protein HMPREF2835_10035 [Actinomyces sp. HMSC072A03]OFT55856.1 hypothetical protein HMPREF3152_04180 [Actinomyces sp. HMSC06A08]MDK8098947.1 glycosyltransferase [Winkia neuii]MDU3134582.1 glycosyltransferase [Winkia neuii]